MKAHRIILPIVSLLIATMVLGVYSYWYPTAANTSVFQERGYLLWLLAFAVVACPIFVVWLLFGITNLVTRYANENYKNKGKGFDPSWSGYVSFRSRPINIAWTVVEIFLFFIVAGPAVGYFTMLLVSGAFVKGLFFDGIVWGYAFGLWPAALAGLCDAVLILGIRCYKEFRGLSRYSSTMVGAIAGLFGFGILLLLRGGLAVSSADFVLAGLCLVSGAACGTIVNAVAWERLNA